MRRYLHSASLGAAILFGRFAFFAIRTLKLGSGSTLPGKIALKLYPQLLNHFCGQLRQGTIMITGTNGKTTTTLLLHQMFQGQKVICNRSGANFESGIVTECLKYATLQGRMDADFGLFEVDELALVHCIEKVKPLAIVLLNLFRDQMARYGEMQTILKKWGVAFSKLKTTQLFINADDPALCHFALGLDLPKKFFGLTEPKRYLDKIPHTADAVYCPACTSKLSYQGVYLAHLGDYICSNCTFCKEKPSLDSSKCPSITPDIFNKYNTMAALTVALSFELTSSQIQKSIRCFKPAFGRGEYLACEKKKIALLLSKNPVSLNEMLSQTIDLYQQKRVQALLFVLNDQTMDSTDISWIWDADLEGLTHFEIHCVVSGSRAYEMALRLQYCMPKERITVEKDLSQALLLGLRKTQAGSILPILPTYSAMLQVRKLLLGRKIL